MVMATTPHTTFSKHTTIATSHPRHHSLNTQSWMPMMWWLPSQRLKMLSPTLKSPPPVTTNPNLILGQDDTQEHPMAGPSAPRSFSSIHCSGPKYWNLLRTSGGCTFLPYGLFQSAASQTPPPLSKNASQLPSPTMKMMVGLSRKVWMLSPFDLTTHDIGDRILSQIYERNDHSSMSSLLSLWPALTDGSTDTDLGRQCLLPW